MVYAGEVAGEAALLAGGFANHAGTALGRAGPEIVGDYLTVAASFGREYVLEKDLCYLVLAVEGIRSF